MIYYTANNGTEAIVCTDATSCRKFIGCKHTTFYNRLRKSNPFEYRGYFVARTELIKSKRGGKNFIKK